MNKTINLIGQPDKQSTFLLVWQAEFIKISSLECDGMKTAIYTNFDRVYGRKEK